MPVRKLGRNSEYEDEEDEGEDVPPVKEVVARQERPGSWVAVDSLRGTKVTEFSTN